MNSTQSLSLTRNKQYLIAGILLLAMILTRGNITAHLQDASWAIFFLVGFYLNGSSEKSILSRYAFPLFFLVAFVIDLVVIDAQGGVHYCFTPAYPFLIPAYASMWFAGRWFAKNFQENSLGFTKFVGAALIGTFACFFISNLGFYLFAGKFETMSMMGYSQAVAKFLPSYLATTSLYLSFVAAIHLAIEHGRKLGTHAHS